MKYRFTVILAALVFTMSVPAFSAAAGGDMRDVGGMSGKDRTLESSREFSGKPFMEMQNKAGEVKLDFIIQPSQAAPLKLSAPLKRKPLGYKMGKVPDAPLEQLPAAVQRERRDMLELAMDMTMLGLGVVYGGLTFGIPGAVVGGAVTYGIWQAAKASR